MGIFISLSIRSKVVAVGLRAPLVKAIQPVEDPLICLELRPTPAISCYLFVRGQVFISWYKTSLNYVIQGFDLILSAFIECADSPAKGRRGSFDSSPPDYRKDHPVFRSPVIEQKVRAGKTLHSQLYSQSQRTRFSKILSPKGLASARPARAAKTTLDGCITLVTCKRKM